MQRQRSQEYVRRGLRIHRPRDQTDLRRTRAPPPQPRRGRGSRATGDANLDALARPIAGVGDVLQHLVDPWSVSCRATRLRAGGLRIHNMQHWGVMFSRVSNLF
jgi:hypothetical protein